MTDSIPAPAASLGAGQVAPPAPAGDTPAIEALYLAHAGALLALARRLLGSREEGEDVVHDLFCSLPARLGQYRAQGRIEGWLRRTTVNLALDRLRRRKRRGEVGLDDMEGRPGPAPVAGSGLEEALAALADTLRVVVVLKDVEGYTHREIAELLGIRVGTAEVRYHRALRRLRSLLGDDRCFD
jgi:RNA polymerase sigma-70 factor, ECF subfamily